MEVGLVSEHVQQLVVVVLKQGLVQIHHLHMVEQIVSVAHLNHVIHRRVLLQSITTWSWVNIVMVQSISIVQFTLLMEVVGQQGRFLLVHQVIMVRIQQVQDIHRIHVHQTGCMEHREIIGIRYQNVRVLTIMEVVLLTSN